MACSATFGPAVALPLGVFGLFCSSFARIYGQAPQQLGALLATVQILSLDRGIPSTRTPAPLRSRSSAVPCGRSC